MDYSSRTTMTPVLIATIQRRKWNIEPIKLETIRQ